MQQILHDLLTRFPKKMILDTDTYNEVDDQFAVAYAMLSPQLEVLSFNAAPFFNDRSSGPADGMERSYQELHHVTSLTRPGHGIPIYRGASAFMSAPNAPVDSDAAQNIIRTAHAMPDGERLYVVAIGAITNVASALLLDPSIQSRIVVVWLGGNAHQSGAPREFNMHGDLLASQYVFNCGVPVVQIPCDGVCTELLTTIPELDYYLKGKNELCDYLCDIVRTYVGNPYGWSKVIWDVSAVACIALPNCMDRVILPTPYVNQDFYSFNAARHPMIYVRKLNRDIIYADLFRKLAEKDC